MSVVSVVGDDDGSVKARLVRAAEAEIAERGIQGLQMDSVAKRAGVSRATAFRQLGSVSEVLIQVALLRAQRHIEAVDRLMSGKTGAFAKIEAALIYTARELPTDPSIAAMMAQHSATVHDPRVHQAAVGIMGPVLDEGRRNGEIRTDIGVDELIDFLVEQTYLAAEEIDRSPAVTRKRFRHFVIPAIETRSGGGELVSRAREVAEAVTIAQNALHDLARELHRNQGDG
jgi:AcrR family transcriptional regulator